MSRWVIAHWQCDWCKKSAQDENTANIWDRLPEGWSEVDNRDICDQCVAAFADFKSRRGPSEAFDESNR